MSGGVRERAGWSARVTVKICGLTSAADARAAVRAGADYLGFVFSPASRRCLAPAACTWIRDVTGVPKVGVFRDQEVDLITRVRAEAALDLVQLHGAEPPALCELLGGPERVIKAISVGDSYDRQAALGYREVARLLFDTASPSGGGTGRAFDWALLDELPAGLELWLAGGLNQDNVGAAIARLGPAGVDVASGVESAPGRKDPARMRAFIAAVRAAQ